MKSSTHRSAVFAALVGASLIATIAGCASGSDKAQVSMPDGVSGSTNLSTPKELSKDLNFAVGKDDEFVSSAAKSSGAHGVVVVVENTGDDDVKLGTSVHFGPKSAWGSLDGGAPGDFRIDSSSLPKGCDVSGLSINSADFVSRGRESFTVKAHSSTAACTILTSAATPKDGDLSISIAAADGSDLSQTVDVGETFSK